MSSLSPEQFKDVTGRDSEGIATAYRLGRIGNRQRGVVQSRNAPGGRPLQQGGASLPDGTTGVRKMRVDELSDTLMHHYGKAGLKVSKN